MFVMIDNYDSFVYNLAAYFVELKQEIQVIRNDVFTKEDIEQMGNVEGIILSPGPKSPKDSGRCREVVRHFAGKTPILGVCLGHQIIGYEFGASVQKGKCPMHGKVTSLSHRESGIFTRLPKTFQVTRYHSLTVEEGSIPDTLQIDAKASDGAVMALSHKIYPIYGIQFHPEAVLTQYGHEILENFIQICKEWRKRECQLLSAN